MKDLSELRGEIDAIDSQMVNLYQKRMGLTEEVAEYKMQQGKPVLDVEREKQKLAAVAAMVGDDAGPSGVMEMFRQIMASSRKRQYQMMTEHGLIEKPSFTEVERLNYQNARVVFQGLEGAYAELALKEYFGADAKRYHVETWRDAMEAIKNGEADYGVFPIENSTAGFVSENFDLILEYGLCIAGEQVMPIEHALLGVPGAKVSDITDVYSHEQSLAQSDGYLLAHPAWKRHAVLNNAIAAKQVSDAGDIRHAAIASPLNAEIYGLEILQTRIQDSKTNETRFLIVTGRHIFTPDAKKLSVCFEIPHESGSLYQILSHIVYNGLNMDRIESRPVQGRNWEYRFFVDFEGNLNDAAVLNALRGIREESLSLTILGNY